MKAVIISVGFKYFLYLLRADGGKEFAGEFWTRKGAIRHAHSFGHYWIYDWGI